MSKLLHEISELKKRATIHFKRKEEDALSQIMQKKASYETFLASSDMNVAVTDFEKLEGITTPQGVVMPQFLRFGYLFAENTKGQLLDKMPIPLILPCANNNAVLFDMGAQRSSEVTTIFQLIIFRYLLSLPMKLCKFYLADTNFGNNFSFLSNIKNPLLQQETIYRPEDVSKMLFDLGKIVNQASQSYLGTHPNLTAYNMQAGQMAQPYHFVFIDDFPNGFSDTTLKALYNLIKNNNATKAGIHIFINYNFKNNTIRDFDINSYKDICACINSDDKKNISLDNWDIKIPLPKYKAIIDTAVPKNVNKIIDFINYIEEDKATFSLDSWIEDLKEKKLVWKGSTIDGIRVPIGFTGIDKHFNFYLANDNDSNCNDFFALVAGRPGYGKTVLLHNVIINSCMKYSPEELNLYLADFAEGASFSIYRNLPHAKALMLSNNREYALRILEHIVAEAKHRSHLYQQAQREYGQQVTKLSDYRSVTGKKLPRIMLIMDEFHYLFQTGIDETTLNARDVLCNGIKQWRKFGISVILCTQSITGVSFGDAEDIITYRFALNLLEMDSKSVIRNGAAKSLMSKGQAIMNNTADGNEQMNVEFQCAFTPRYLEHTEWLAKRYQEIFGKLAQKYICESGIGADIADNQILLQCIETNNSTPNANYCDVFLGKPDLLRDMHTRVRFRRQQNSNSIYIGEDFEAVVNNIAISLIQIYKQSHSDSKLYIIDCFNVGDEFYGALDSMADLSSNFIVGNIQSLPNLIDEISKELAQRKEAVAQGKVTEERIVLSILNIQNSYELRPQQSGFMPTPSPVTEALSKIIQDGPPLGVHCIFHSLNYSSLIGTGNVFDNKIMNNFENKILLRGADTQNILLGGLRVGSINENGQMIVINNKLDKENYEQCNAYSEITTNNNIITDFMSQLFECNRNRYE